MSINGNPNTQLRKQQTLLTSVALAANGVFQSPWFDSQVDGTVFVTVQSISNVNAAATNGLQVQESEDQSNIRAVQAAGAQTTIRLGAYIRQRYWRIQYTNGAVLQASFSLYATALNFALVGDGLGQSGSPSEAIVAVTGNSAAIVFADGVSNSSGALWTTAAGLGGTQRVFSFLFNGATWDRPRTPTTFKQVSTAANGSTALWTPTAGKKFRLMRFLIQVTALAKAAVAADLVIKLLDVAADIGIGHIVTIPAAAAGNGVIAESSWIDLGNGYLSALANNALNINLSFALTGGLVNVVACGTEE